MITGRPVTRPPAFYRCPCCLQEFATVPDLGAHLWDKHPWALAETGNTGAGTQRQLPLALCAACGTTFQPIQNRQQWCSDPCRRVRDAAYRRAHKEAGRMKNEVEISIAATGFASEGMGRP
jgi:predicted nucleic acid-binding Zn ribbon protein